MMQNKGDTVKNNKNNKIKTTICVIILLVIIIVAAIYSLYRYLLFPKKYEKIVNKAGEIYNVDPYLILAVIKQESSFNEDAISKSRAKGLMQILDKTADETVKDINSISNKDYDIYDVYTNINIGTKYLSNLIEQYDGNIYIALTAYNAGMGNISSWFDFENESYNTLEQVVNDIKFNETKQYVINIVRYYNIYRTIYK